MTRQKWYYKVRGGHTHVRVFMYGGKCGDLCFRNEEMDEVQRTNGSANLIDFINEDLPTSALAEPTTRNIANGQC